MERDHNRLLESKCLRRTWAFVAWLLLMSSFAAGAETVSKEYQLKAAFLYNFTKFVEWSAPSLATPGSPITIGVFGANPFGGELENVVRNRKVNGHEIVVKRVQTVAGVRGVHLLFVPVAEDARLPELRETLQGSNIVTVGESDAFARSGGMITFVIDGDRVRFDINIAAVNASSVKLSAQLQKLARSIRK
jgi:hypothetical protein